MIHTYREQSRVADKLAKHGATLDNGALTTIIWQPPPFVLQDLLEDQQGTPHLRRSAIPEQLEPPSFCLDMLANDCNINHGSFCNTVPMGHSAHHPFCNTVPTGHIAPCNVT